MSDLNKLKLKDLVFLAQNVSYKKPEKNYNEWTEDEILFEAIYCGVNNRAQIDSLYMGCKICPPMKLLVKDRIRRFVSTFIK